MTGLRQLEKLVGEDKIPPWTVGGSQFRYICVLAAFQGSAQLAKWARERVYSVSSVMERCVRCPQGPEARHQLKCQSITMDPENSAEENWNKQPQEERGRGVWFVIFPCFPTGPVPKPLLNLVQDFGLPPQQGDARRPTASQVFKEVMSSVGQERERGFLGARKAGTEPGNFSL